MRKTKQVLQKYGKVQVLGKRSTKPTICTVKLRTDSVQQMLL